MRYALMLCSVSTRGNGRSLARKRAFPNRETHRIYNSVKNTCLVCRYSKFVLFWKNAYKTILDERQIKTLSGCFH